MTPISSNLAEKILSDEKHLPSREWENEGWLLEGVEAGRFTCLTLAYDGKPLGRFYYSISGGILHVNACVADVHTERAWEVGLIAVEKIARAMGCKAVTSVAGRAGALRRDLASGFEVVGVMVRKNLKYSPPL